MTLPRNRFFSKFSLVPAVLAFSLLLCSWALATPGKLPATDPVGWVFIKDEALIEAPISVVEQHFKDVQKADAMIPGLKTKKILEQLSDSERIDYDHYKLPWPFKDRYTVYRAREEFLSRQKIRITLKSLDNYSFEDKGKVAVKIRESHFLLKSLPGDETKTQVTVNLTVNPGGFLPVWLINLNAKSMSKDLFKNLRRNIRKEFARQKHFQKDSIKDAIVDSVSNL